MAYLFIIALAVWVYSLNTRLGVLETLLNELRQGKSTRTQGEPFSEAPAPQSLDAQQLSRPQVQPTGLAPEQYVPNVAVGPSNIERFFAWLKKDFMVKLGAFLLILALGWFVSYAIENEWIGPMGQITIGILVGLVFMVMGVWRIVTHPHQGGIFTVLGSTTVLLTLWAAREIYDFFTPGTALLMMALSVVFVAFMSVKYNRNALALAGLILASVSPLLTNSPAPDIAGLFTYLTLVVLGTLWVVYLRGWSNLTFASLVIVFLYGIPFLVFGVDSGDRDIALLFAFLFTAIFFIANILGLIANENESNRKAHIAIALGTGLYLIAWVTAAADDHWQSLLYVAWMLVFSLGSFIVYRILASRVPFYIYGGTSVVLLAAATAAELSGPVLTIAFTIEVALLVLLTTLLLRDVGVSRVLSMLFAGPILLSLGSIDSSAWYEGVIHEDFFVLIVLGIVLALVGRQLYGKESGSEQSAMVGPALITLAALYGLVLIWLVLHAGTQQAFTESYDYWSNSDSYTYYSTESSAYELATMYSLIIYTAIGLVLFIAGRRNDRKGLVWGGGALLGFVVAHLLLVEVWDMELVPRIITFVVIGVLLISTAFIRKHKQATEVLPQDNQPHA